MLRNMSIIFLLCWLGTGKSSLEEGSSSVELPSASSEEPVFSSSEERVAGGVVCPKTEFPFLVAMKVKIAKKDYYYAASIVGETWALTAASVIVAGEFVHLKSGVSKVDDSAGKTHLLAAQYIHPNFNNITLDYDAALIRVKEPFVYSDKVQPIRLACKTLAPKTAVYVGGWGSTDLSKPKSDTKELQCAMMIVYERDDCRQLQSNLNVTFTDNMLCVGDKIGKKDAGDLDRGSGLTTVNREFLSGILSQAVGVGDANKPAIYTDVPSIRDWVIETIEINERIECYQCYYKEKNGGIDLYLRFNKTL